MAIYQPLGVKEVADEPYLELYAQITKLIPSVYIKPHPDTQSYVNDELTDNPSISDGDVLSFLWWVRRK